MDWGEGPRIPSILPKIPHFRRRIRRGEACEPEGTMGAMKAMTAPDRCNAREQRLARVKFVVLPHELTPPSETDQGRLARWVASVRNSAIRVIGCLEAARP
jgi:hypothetical protein